MSSADSLRSVGALGREASSALAMDGRSLDALRREAQRDPHAAVKKAATQFEALFMQMVLKSMREATLKSGLMDGGSGEAMMTSMFDQQLATTMAGQGGTLAQVLTAQLTRHLSPAAVDGAEADRSSAIAAPQAATGLLRYLETAQLAPTAAASAEPASSESFVRRHWQDALEAERASGVPAGFILSQAALESGWGKHEIRHTDGRASHNLFGIKAGEHWRGDAVQVRTTEYENGAAQKITDRFRSYDSYADAFKDWATMMVNNPRYRQVRDAGADAQGFAQALQDAGYATDPRYRDKLMGVMRMVFAAAGGSAQA